MESSVFDAAMLKVRNQAIEECARIVERWSLPTIQTPSMWLIDQSGIAAEIRALACSDEADKSPNIEGGA